MTTDKEKELLTIMISIYEKGHQQDLSELKEYAFKRIDCCPRKEEKHSAPLALFIVIKKNIAIK